MFIVLNYEILQVIANDLDVQRCHLLIHQTRRMCSPNLMVTNHEAQHFPGLRKEKDLTNQLNGSREFQLNLEDIESIESDDEKGLYFDRVLCDVPCSGDGTIRKAPDIWKKWYLCFLLSSLHVKHDCGLFDILYINVSINVSMLSFRNAGIANGLHRLQVQIAMRGAASNVPYHSSVSNICVLLCFNFAW